MSVIIGGPWQFTQVLPPPPPPPPGGVYPNRYFVPSYQEYAFSDVKDPVSSHDLGATTSHNFQVRTAGTPSPYLSVYGTNPPSPGFYMAEGNAAIQWNNVGGDWADVGGVLQGPTPFASTLVNDAGSGIEFAVTWNILNLVQLWLNGTPNAGLWLRGNNANTIVWRSRWYTTDTTKRPFLTLTSVSQGTVIVPCGRNIWMSSSSQSTLAGQPSFQTSGTSAAGMLWFDLSAFTPADISAAVLTCYTSDQFGSQTVNVFRILNPADQSTIGPQVIGLSASYPNDVGIENDPSVIFVEKFDVATYQNDYMHGTGGDGSTWQTTADTNGFSPLVGLYNAAKLTVNVSNPLSTGDNSAWEAHWSPWRGVGKYIKGQMTDPPEELYLRYYLTWGLDWDPSPDGGKMPGFDGRFADLDTGHSVLTQPGMGRGNSGSGTDGMTGWSTRCNFGRYKTSIATGALDNDPLYTARAMGSGDLYHADMSNSFGGDFGWNYNYLGTMRKGEWNCIELHVKMNSVTDPTEIATRLFGMYNNLDGTATCYSVSPITNPGFVVGATIIVGGVQAGFSAAYNGFQFYHNIVSISAIPQDPSGNPYSGSVFVIDGVPANALAPGPSGARNPFTNALDQQWAPIGAGPTVPDYLCCCFGQGNYDGIVEGWVNGRLAGRYSKLRFRHCKRQFNGKILGIDNVWLCVFEGGGAPPGPIGWPPYSCYISNVIVSTAYIGPLMVSQLPLWLQGKPLNTWLPVGSQSAMGQMDYGPLVTAGLTNAGGADIGYGTPSSVTCLLYMGGTLRKADSDFLVFGGGGARSWAGNDVRGLRLTDDAPRWQVRNPTSLSPSSQVWLNSYHNALSPSGQTPDPTNAYMKDGVTPNARHAYWVPQFHNALDSFFTVGVSNTWEQDSTPNGGKNVDRLDWTSKAWDPPGTYPPYPIQVSGDSHFVVKHPTTEHIFIAVNGSRLYEFDPVAKTMTLRYTDGNTDYERRGAVIDPTRNIIFMIGQKAAVQNIPLTQDLTTFVVTQATFTGPFAGSINETNLYWAGGLVYDPNLDLFLYYQDDGFMYTIKWLSNSSYFVDRMVMQNLGTNPAPAPGGMTFSGNPGLWGKMQYVPNLKGVVVLTQGGNLPTLFIKTAN